MCNNTTTTTTTDNTTKDNKTSLIQKCSNIITNKPAKKIYRIILLIILGIIFNNTNGNHVTNLLTDTLKQNLCQDHNATMAAF